jgi:hypothetical protein
VSRQSLDELMAEPREGLRIEDEDEVLLGPDTEWARRARQVVEVKTFEDLQQLDLVPRWLDQRAMREAVARDDEEASGVARAQMVATRPPCGCEGDGAVDPDLRPAKLTQRSEYRRSFVGARKAFHPHLAALMTESSDIRFYPSDLVVAMTWGWFTRLVSVRVLPFPIWLFETVEIGRNSTLALSPAEKGLYCGDLKIHLGGKLVVQGSGAKIRCLSAQGKLL